MFDNDTNTYSILSEEDIAFKQALEFKKLRKFYLPNNGKSEVVIFELLKESSKFFRFQLPPNLAELFIRIEDAPYFWVIENPLLLQSEQHLKSTKTSSLKNNIKVHFNKWLITKPEHQKEIVAALLLSEYKSLRNSVDFMDTLYYALVLIYDKRYFNPTLALEELEKAAFLISQSSIPGPVKNELNYYVHLYAAFTYLKIANYESSVEYFNKALEFYPFGVTAKFYLALTMLKQNINDIALQLVKEIFETDLSRLLYSIEESNKQMFEYFLRNPLFVNIFQHDEYASIIDLIETNIINSVKSSKSLIDIRIRVDQYLKLNYEEFCDEKSANEIKFLNEVLIEDYPKNYHTYNYSIDRLNDKFNSFIDNLKNTIKTKYYSRLENEVKKYNQLIEESKKNIEELQEDLINIKEELRKKLSQSISSVEAYIKDQIEQVEESIRNLGNQPSLDPNTAFKNTMTYNFVISIIVFLFGGIAGYFNNSNYFDSDFYNLLGKIILTGVKWSFLTFIIGFLIAAIVSALVTLERSNRKQSLNRKIVELSKVREYQIDMLKREADNKEKALTENFNDRIEATKKRIDSINSEKNKREKELKQQAEESIKPYFENLDPLIS